MKKFILFLNALEENKIFYKLSKVRPDYIMVEVVVPGERWEIEFSGDDICIEKFVKVGTMYDESELDVLFEKFSD